MKVVFFDIDGTLVDFDGTIPPSTLDALHQAQAMGHAVFLCTGRSRGMIDERLLRVGFDGIVAASGAYVEYHGNVIYHEFFDTTALKQLLDYMAEHHMVYMFQCIDKIVSTTAGNRAFARNMKGPKGDSEDAIERLLQNRVSDDHLLEHINDYTMIEKANYQKSDVGVAQVRADLEGLFDVTAMSFQNAPDSSGEITKVGINKSVGMQKVLDHLCLTREDTIAFGDGPNDYEMIEFAGIGVAMGNATDGLKNLADMTTDSVSNDGIFKGMRKLGLI